uniref:Ketoreductase domain-containing protein n=1 Tax=Polytomella parva TaxID=51329 RepID=A0A7S0UK52_9CHLO|mmetsp:Transcript_12184/g.21840  ORF Transcript_12184/g.21840 Transcript_12184/m.21840 type:complete len:268 (+) Transcript_12184:47-850(+)
MSVRKSSLYQPVDIEGYTVLITGASSGIGEACAFRFAEAGCKLILLARREERLQNIKSQLTSTYQVPVHIVAMDVRDIKAIEALPDQLPEEFSKVDILVNNAGLALGVAPVVDNQIEDVVAMLETNVTATVVFTKVFVAGMIARGRGHLINISSVAGKESYPGGSVYCASKHAVSAFTASARHDLVGTPIRVTSISPGAVKTEFSAVRYKGDQAKADAVYDGFVPLCAADIADNVIYASTRPEHVQIADILVFASSQASARGLARKL